MGVVGVATLGGLEVLADGTVLVRGELNIHEANEALDTDLPEGDEFESVAGPIMDRTGRFVDEGESVTHEHIKLTAETVDNNRILEVRIDLSDTENQMPGAAEGT